MGEISAGQTRRWRIALVALIASAVVVGPGTGAEAATTWACSTSTNTVFYTWTDWLSGEPNPKYNTSRFRYRECVSNSTWQVVAKQFISSETQASRGCGAGDWWKVKTQNFTNGNFLNESAFSAQFYNDCPMATAGVVDIWGDKVSSVSTISMQTKVLVRCTISCVDFYASRSFQR